MGGSSQGLELRRMFTAGSSSFSGRQGEIEFVWSPRSLLGSEKDEILRIVYLSRRDCEREAPIGINDQVHLQEQWRCIFRIID